MAFDYGALRDFATRNPKYHGPISISDGIVALGGLRIPVDKLENWLREEPEMPLVHPTTVEIDMFYVLADSVGETELHFYKRPQAHSSMHEAIFANNPSR